MSVFALIRGKAAVWPLNKPPDHAKRALQKLVAELATRSASATLRLEDGLEETLTIHRLGVFAELGTSVKITHLAGVRLR